MADEKPVEEQSKETAPPPQQQQPPSEPIPQSATDSTEAIPDPDEDDLDDLDEVLDEFSISSKPAPTSSGPGRPDEPPALPPHPAVPVPAAAAALPIPGLSTADAPDPAAAPFDEDEFARELQAGMADLLGDMDTNPAMQKQFEDMLRELGAAAALEIDSQAPPGTLPSDTNDAASRPSTSAADRSFQDGIKRTMDRMASSGEAASAAAANASEAEADFMAELLKQMETDGMGSEDDFSKMLLGMMEQLTNKEILYEPMKELHDKFPAWLEANASKTPKADLDRYEIQKKLVGEIVGKFEEEGYSDDKVESREYIVERMQKMQSAGSPPPDLVGDMNAAQEALGELDQGCPTQ